MVLLGEGDVDVHLVADLGADKLVLKAGDEAARAEHEVVPRGGAAVELHVAQIAGVVDVDLIVELRGAVGDLDIAGGALAGALDFGADVVVGDLGGLFLDAEVLVRAELDVGADEHLDGELQLLTATDLLHVQLGAVDGLDAVLLEGGAVDFGKIASKASS